MKRQYRKKAGLISIELRRIREMCHALEKEMGEDQSEDGGDDDADQVNFSDGCTFVDSAVNCFIAFEPTASSVGASTAFPCPICGVAANQPCRTPKGRKARSVHDTRPFKIE